MTAPTAELWVDPTAESWVDRFLASDRERRLEVAAAVLTAMDASNACWMDDHEERIARASAQRAAFSGAVQELVAVLPELSPPARPGVETALRRLASTLGVPVGPGISGGA